jgi:hypothetical protein
MNKNKFLDRWTPPFRAYKSLSYERTVLQDEDVAW